MANGNPDVYMGSQGTPSRPVKWLTREKDGPWLSCFNLSAYGRARRTETAKATRRHPQLDAGKRGAWSSRPPNSIPCYSLHRSVGNLHPTPGIHMRFPMFISLADGAKAEMGDFPAKLPEARDFPYRDRFCWTASATKESAQIDVIS
jgi:hypothetical protein